MKTAQTPNSETNDLDFSPKSTFIAGLLLGLMILLIPSVWTIFSGESYDLHSLNLVTDFLLMSFAFGYSIGGFRDNDVVESRIGIFSIGMVLSIALPLLGFLFYNDQDLKQSLIIFGIAIFIILTTFFLKKSQIISRTLDKEEMFSTFIRGISLLGYTHFLYQVFFQVYFEKDSYIFFDYIWFVVVAVTLIALIIILIPDVQKRFTSDDNNDN